MKINMFGWEISFSLSVKFIRARKCTRIYAQHIVGAAKVKEVERALNRGKDLELLELTPVQIEHLNQIMRNTGAKLPVRIVRI